MCRPFRKSKSFGSGFTLIELLVVISIVGMISSIVMASLGQARKDTLVASGQEFDGHTYSAFYDNITVHYPFDDGVLPPTDVSGNNQTVSCQGSTSITPNGIYGSALDFNSMSDDHNDESTSCINLNFPYQSFNPGNGSVSFWVYPRARGNIRVVRIKNREIRIGPEGVVTMTGTTIQSNSTVPLNAWTQILISWGAGRTDLYINGLFDESSFGTLTFNNNSTSLTIGGGQRSNMILDQFAIYNKSIQLP